ncbi:MAG: hypothetical protein WDZ70_02275 [Candidatus Paceibacterota bacterium]
MDNQLYQAWFVSPTNTEDNILVKKGHFPLYQESPGSKQKTIARCFNAPSHFQATISRVWIASGSRICDGSSSLEKISQEKILILSRGTFSNERVKKLVEGKKQALERRVRNLFYEHPEHVELVFGFGFEDCGERGWQIRFLALARGCIQIRTQEILRNGKRKKVTSEFQYDTKSEKFVYYSL